MGSSPTTRTTSEQSPLCSDVFLCLWQKRRHPPAPLFLLSKSNPLRWASIWFWAETWRHWHLYCCDISSPYSVRSTGFLFFSVPAEPAASWRRRRVQSAAVGRAGGTPALPLVRIQSLGPCGVSFGILRFLIKNCSMIVVRNRAAFGSVKEFSQNGLQGLA